MHFFKKQKYNSPQNTAYIVIYKAFSINNKNNKIQEILIIDDPVEHL